MYVDFNEFRSVIAVICMLGLVLFSSVESVHSRIVLLFMSLLVACLALLVVDLFVDVSVVIYFVLFVMFVVSIVSLLSRIFALLRMLYIRK